MDHHNNHLTIKTFMAITAERDAAIRERNMALEERKRAFAERDMAILQRDAAIAERNSAMQERDEALVASLRFQETSMDPNDDDSSGNEQLTTEHVILYQQQQQQQMHVVPEEAATAYNYSNLNNPREAKAPSLVLVKRESRSSRDDSGDFDDDYSSGTAIKPPPKKGGKQQQSKEGKQTKSTKSPSRLLVGKKRKVNSSSNNSWKNIESAEEEEEDLNKQQHAVVSWKDNNLGLNQISFDESSMPVPVCTCTGSPQPCYRWGSGGWQSACCTTTISMYPLPQVANKRYSRVGGRKMSGSAFTKLLNRLAAEGYDFSNPLDLKDHWAKHGTNRYSTLK